MNREFEKRSKTVFHVLSLLVKIDQRIVFLGGSAIQALFEKPKRLSIDLDISYPGEILNIIKSLEEEGYAVKQRQSRNPNFLFYTISKGGVIVKLDISRFVIPETEKHNVSGTEVRIPKKCYFLAAKLSSLSFGTIGCFEAEPVQVIKDIFDIDCLLGIGVDLDHMANDWKHITSDQNKLRGTGFSEVQCAKSAQSALLRCIEVAPLPDFFIPSSALGSFEDSLVRGRITRPELATMAARALLLLVSMGNGFYELEKTISSDSQDRNKLDEAEQTLVKRGVLDAKQIRTIKLTAPRALSYLRCWSEKQV